MFENDDVVMENVKFNPQQPPQPPKEPAPAEEPEAQPKEPQDKQPKEEPDPLPLPPPQQPLNANVKMNNARTPQNVAKKETMN